MFRNDDQLSDNATRARSEISTLPNQKLISQEAFRTLLSVERCRSERSGNPIMVMIVDITELLTHKEKKRSKKENAKIKIEQAVDSICKGTRVIDIKGWYAEGESIGIIFTEISKDSRFIIMEKVRKSFVSTLAPESISKVGISTYWYPSDLQNEDPRYNEIFYPDISRTPVARKSALAMKRAIDILGSVVGLILFAPVFMLIPAIIKLTSSGPVFFRQERVGKGGKVFRIYKFRTMTTGTSESCHQEYMKQFIKGCAEQVSDETGQKVFKLVNDSRITSIGKFLRKTSLDEVPQFLNVLFGDMSLVGPRPPIPYEVEEYDAWHRRRIQEFKPGITGYWQVEGRSTTNFDGMVRMDIRYIKIWSNALDIKMIVKTPIALIKGAY
ncbi:MAG: sugar transferase [Chitinispirillaceae bacterium]